MKQKTLIKEVYRACFEHDKEMQRLLYLEEMRKIFKRKSKGKAFTPKWSLVQI
jgi:hypothetical protein